MKTGKDGGKKKGKEGRMAPGREVGSREKDGKRVNMEETKNF